MTVQVEMEESPSWDEAKADIIGEQCADAFTLDVLQPGGTLPGRWWKAVVDGRLVGFGWLVEWDGEHQLMVAVAEDARGEGVGRYLLGTLERALQLDGVSTAVGVVENGNPNRSRVLGWLTNEGYEATIRANGGDQRVSSANIPKLWRAGQDITVVKQLV